MMRISKRKGQTAVFSHELSQALDQLDHIGLMGMGKNGVGQHVVEFTSKIRNGQIYNTCWIELKIVAVIENPVCPRIIPAALINCVRRHINAPIVAFPNSTAGQRNSAIASKIQYFGVFPIWMIQLEIEIGQVLRSSRNERHWLPPEWFGNRCSRSASIEIHSINFAVGTTVEGGVVWLSEQRTAHGRQQMIVIVMADI